MTDLGANNEAVASSTPHRKIRIGDLLVSNGVITEPQLMSALAEQKKTGQKLGHTLVDMGLIDEFRLLEFLSQQLQVPLVDLATRRVDPRPWRGDTAWSCSRAGRMTSCWAWRIRRTCLPTMRPAVC